MPVSDPKRTQQVDCRVPPASIFAFDLGQSAFEFVGPKYSKRTRLTARSLLWENEIMQKTIRCSAIVAITWLLSVAVLISAAQFDVAQAKKGRAAALGCGKELQKHCGGMPVQANNMLECLQKNQEKLPPRCVAHAN